MNREVKDDRSADDGNLTATERQQINNQQNNLSHSIYQDKHNANTAHYGNNEVGQRRENQQDRIANGIRNGSMNAGEAARTENREQGINEQIHADRSGQRRKADRAGASRRSIASRMAPAARSTARSTTENNADKRGNYRPSVCSATAITWPFDRIDEKDDESQAARRLFLR